MPCANEPLVVTRSCPALTDVERRFARSWLEESDALRVAAAKTWSARRQQLHCFEVTCWPVRWPGGGTLLISDAAQAWLCSVLVADPLTCVTWAAQLADT